MKIYIIIGAIMFSLGSGFSLWLTKAIKPEIKLECKPAPCNCPKIPPCQAIDFDKIRSKNLTLHVQQHFNVANDSSISIKLDPPDWFRIIVAEELAKSKTVKCR